MRFFVLLKKRSIEIKTWNFSDFQMRIPRIYTESYLVDKWNVNESESKFVWVVFKLCNFEE